MWKSCAATTPKWFVPYSNTIYLSVGKDEGFRISWSYSLRAIFHSKSSEGICCLGEFSKRLLFWRVFLYLLSYVVFSLFHHKLFLTGLFELACVLLLLMGKKMFSHFEESTLRLAFPLTAIAKSILFTVQTTFSELGSRSSDLTPDHS